MAWGWALRKGARIPATCKGARARTRLRVEPPGPGPISRGLLNPGCLSHQLLSEPGWPSSDLAPGPHSPSPKAPALASPSGVLQLLSAAAEKACPALCSRTSAASLWQFKFLAPSQTTKHQGTEPPRSSKAGIILGVAGEKGDNVMVGMAFPNIKKDRKEMGLRGEKARVLFREIKFETPFRHPRGKGKRK